MRYTLSFTSAAPPALLAALLLVSACGGGGGGGSAPPVNDQGDDTVGDSVDAGDITPEPTGSCQVEINSATLQSVEGVGDLVELQDLGPGCDYLISESVTLDNISSIGSGVLIALAGGVTVEFSSSELAVIGTDSNPVVFQRSNPASAWQSIVFGNREVTVEHARFLGGGASDTAPDYSPASYEEAAVLFSRLGVASTNASISNSVFASSESAGLQFGSRMQIDSFVDNTFSDNASFSLIVSERQHLDVTDSLSRNIFGGSTTQPILFDMDNVSSVFRDQMVFRDIGVPYMFANMDGSQQFSGSGLLFMSGVEVWFDENSTLDTSGVSRSGLYVLGEQASPVTFSGVPGREAMWGGLSIGPTSVLRHFEITGGGLGELSNGSSLLISGGNGNALGISGGTIVEHGVIRDSQGFALKCDGAFTDNIVDLTFENSSIGDIEAACGFDPTENPGLAVIDGLPDYTARIDDCGTLLLNERISTPSILENSAADCDYLVVGDVSYSSNLRIEPGTTVVFSRAASMEVSTLIAEGTDDSPILLRGANPSPGYWVGLTVDGNNSSMRHMAIQDAGWNDADEFLSASEQATRSLLTDAINTTAASLTLGGLESALSDISLNRSAAAGLFMVPDATLFSLDNLSVDAVSTFSVVLSPQHVEAVAMALTTTPGVDHPFSQGLLLNDDSLVRRYVAFRNIASRFSVRLADTLTLAPLNVPWHAVGLDMGVNGLVLDAGVDMRIFDKISYSTIGSLGDDPVARLQVNGTETEPVTISGFNEDPDDVSWVGIRTGNAFDVDFKVNNAIVNGAEIGIAIQNNGGIVDISDSTFRNGGSAVSCGSFTKASVNLSNVSFENQTGPEVVGTCP